MRDDLLPRLLQHDSLDIGAYHGYYQDARIDCDILIKNGQLKLIRQHTGDIADDERGNNIVCNRKEHDEADKYEVLRVGLCIRKQALHDVAVLHVPLEAHGLFFVLNGSIHDDKHDRNNSDHAADYEKRKIITHFQHLLPHFQASAARPYGCIRDSS